MLVFYASYASYLSDLHLTWTQFLWNSQWINIMTSLYSHHLKISKKVLLKVQRILDVPADHREERTVDSQRGGWMSFHAQGRKHRRKFQRSCGGYGTWSWALKNKHSKKQWRRKQLHFVSWEQHNKGKQYTVDQWIRGMAAGIWGQFQAKRPGGSPRKWDSCSRRAPDVSANVLLWKSMLLVLLRLSWITNRHFCFGCFWVAKCYEIFWPWSCQLLRNHLFS